MRRITSFALTTALACGFGQAAVAVTTTVDLTEPENFANEPENEVPAMTTDVGTIGDGAWQADPTIGSDEQHQIFVQGGAPGPYVSGGQESYEADGVNPNLLFPADQDVTLNDVDSISFDTDQESPGWFVDIFTEGGGGTDDPPDGSFYQTNLDLVPGNLSQSSAPGSYSTYEFSMGKGMAIRDLSDQGKPPHEDGPYTFSEVKGEFGDESIRFLSLATATNYKNFDGRIDNFNFDYTLNGASYSRTIDFEEMEAPAPIPVPAGLPLLASAGGLLGWVARRRRKS